VLRLLGPVSASLTAIRRTLANDGLRRLEIAWTLGVAADQALLVVLLVSVYGRAGVVGVGLLGAFRMVPAVIAGLLSGAALERFRSDRILLALGLTRAVSAVLVAFVIATTGPTPLLFAMASIAAAAGAPVRPTQATLMPAFARSPAELVAANMAWTTGEGLGAFAGPFLAGLLISVGAPATGAMVSGGIFLLTSAIVAGLRFEQAADASGGGHSAGGLRLLDGLRALRRRPVPAWTMVGVYGQVLTRGLLNALVVVAAVELLRLGDPGVGMLNAALGFGGLLGAVFALSIARSNQVVRTQAAALAYWGAPIAVIGLFPIPAVAAVSMVVIGIANATYDVAIFTVFQRGCSNDERAPVFAAFEGVVGLGAVTGSLLAPVLLAGFGARGAMAVGGAILPILALVIYSRIGRADRITVVDEPTIQLLRQVPAFAELPLTALERLAADLDPVAFPAGTELMHQGDPGDRFIVIESGEIEVFVDGRLIQRLGPGSGVGEIALLRRTPRTATVVAVSEVTGYSVGAPAFLAAVSGPAAAAVTERIAAANLARAGAVDLTALAGIVEA
jgi:hypothetical protein